MSSEVKEAKEAKISTEDDIVKIPQIGDVSVKVINRNGLGGTAFAIHGMNSFVKREWVPVGNLLAQHHDLAVYVPNLHSNPSTVPGKQESFAALNWLATKHYKLSNLLLCGKSWGTRAAAQMVCSEADVRALILANPVNDDYLDTIHKKGFPVMYITSEDDFAKKTMELYEKEWKGDPNFVSFVGPATSPALIKPTNLGGHLMTQAFIKPILDFTKKFYLK